MWRNRDRDLIRDMIYQRRNSDMEPVGDRISSVTELGPVGLALVWRSRVDMVL